MRRGSTMLEYEISELQDNHRPWVKEMLAVEWGGSVVVTRGRMHDASSLPGFIALAGERRVGLVTYRIVDESCELVTLNSLVEGQGIGSALVQSVKGAAEAVNCHRLWLITTNDNVKALRFYQKRGFHITVIHCDAIGESRKLKPSIPIIGLDGIPIRDEIELEIILNN